MASLHIRLDRHSIDLKEIQVVNGYIELSLVGLSVVHLSTRVTGQELVYTPYNNSACFFSNASTPQTLDLEAGLHKIPFSIALKADLPNSLAHRLGSIFYSVGSVALVGDVAMRAHLKFQVNRSQSKLSTIYWGSSPDRKWRYELEVPKYIALEEQSLRLSLRLKSLIPNSSKTESRGCLLGCQLWEFASFRLVEIATCFAHIPCIYKANLSILYIWSFLLLPFSVPEKAETQHSQSMNPYTCLLTEPSSTWSNPLQLQLDLSKSDSHVDTKCDRICIKHLLHLTLAFNESANVYLDFPAIICGQPPAPELGHRRDSSLAEFTDEKLITSL
ncbi:hypothetical protein INT43_005299 [Umbelopsis isabellina]|uniref:Uncharacterized protein n=1 Tax=Mortierella isabellina TaxID=91625 RepID=A0A8H7PH25_MORIS|nr:hypothetical protein INT43_005299 [Umbelopsis isabellina]